MDNEDTVKRHSGKERGTQAFNTACRHAKIVLKYEAALRRTDSGCLYREAWTLARQALSAPGSTRLQVACCSGLVGNLAHTVLSTRAGMQIEPLQMRSPQALHRLRNMHIRLAPSWHML